MRDASKLLREADAATPQAHRRKAFRLELFIVGFVISAVAFVCLSDVGTAKKPRAHKASYTHIDVCKSTLRGFSSDDDIHRVGVQTGAKSFGGWTSYGRFSNTSVYVWGAFNYSYGKVVLYRGRCSGGDYGADWFDNG